MEILSFWICPNEDNPDLFQSLQSKICLYENTSVIVVGDWNVVQNYDKDTFNYQSENNPRAQIKVHQMMNDLDLVDIWRVQHPSQKKFHSGVQIKNKED